MKSREVRLTRRPRGALAINDFRVAVTEVPRPGPGDVLVRNQFLSIDAAVRLRLDEVGQPGYLRPLGLGEPLQGLAVGVVVESLDERFAPGDLVQHAMGFREYAIVRADTTALAGAGGLSKLDPDLAPPEIHLSLLGGTGLTAWAGLHEVAKLRGSDVIWVSAAAGAVGSVVCQLARLHGCRVLASAGCPEKIAYAREKLRVDAAFGYRGGHLARELEVHAPDGIDVYWDNVGGSHLDAALVAMRPQGRVVLCGAISGYEKTKPGESSTGVRNLFQATAKGITLQGFRAGFYADKAEAIRKKLARVWAAGDVMLDLNVFEGIASAPHALVALLKGRNTGKVLVRL